MHERAGSATDELNAFAELRHHTRSGHGSLLFRGQRFYHHPLVNTTSHGLCKAKSQEGAGTQCRYCRAQKRLVLAPTLPILPLFDQPFFTSESLSDVSTGPMARNRRRSFEGEATAERKNTLESIANCAITLHSSLGFGRLTRARP